MTHVDFEAIVKTSEMGGDAAKTFCTDSVMKRLKGKLSVEELYIKKTKFIKTYVDLAKQVPGRLFFSLKENDTCTLDVYEQLVLFLDAINKVANVTYASQVAKQPYFNNYRIWKSPDMLFEYYYSSHYKRSLIYYRPALLNGRHVVDVLRAVCGPADVSEAELDRVKKEATERARDLEDWFGERFTGLEDQVGWRCDYCASLNRGA